MTRLLESIAVNYPPRAEYVNPPKPKISTFNEKTDDIKSFVNRFETIANALRWPKEVWGIQLAGILSGKGLKAIRDLTAEQLEDCKGQGAEELPCAL